MYDDFRFSLARSAVLLYAVRDKLSKAFNSLLRDQISMYFAANDRDCQTFNSLLRDQRSPACCRGFNRLPSFQFSLARSGLTGTKPSECPRHSLSILSCEIRYCMLRGIWSYIILLSILSCEIRCG